MIDINDSQVKRGVGIFKIQALILGKILGYSRNSKYWDIQDTGPNIGHNTMDFA